MSTIVIRPGKRDRGNPEYFTERMLDWPDDAVSAHRRCLGDPWVFTCRADVLRERRARMERALANKRASSQPQRRAMYLWVFHVPGFIFGGWWAYLVGVGGQTVHAGGFKGQLDDALLRQVMDLFPVENPHPLLPLGSSEWMSLFAERYHRGHHCRRPQGKAVLWALVRNGNVIEVMRP